MVTVALTEAEQTEVYREAIQEDTARRAKRELERIKEKARRQAEKQEYGVMRYYLRMIYVFVAGEHNRR